MTKIYVIRHAESEGNIYRRANGHFNGLVTDRGYKQIELLRERFAGVHIDAVYSSDLSRTCTTAAAISEPRDLEINTTDMLREVNMGEWEDTAWGDLEYRYREMSYNFSNNPARWSVKGSEPYEHVQARMSRFITETAKRHDGECIAMFSHGFAIRSLVCLLEGIASHETEKVPYYDNTAVMLLSYDNGKLTIDHHGDNSHLCEEHSTLAQQSWWRPEARYIPENLRFMPLNEVCSEDLLRIFKAKAGKRALVDMQYAAFLVDEPIGIVGIDSMRDSKVNIGWLSYIHVIPAHRKKHFATQLLGLAISDFRKMRREKLRMEIPTGSTGIHFMNKCGFNMLDATDTMCVMEKNIKNW